MYNTGCAICSARQTERLQQQCTKTGAETPLPRAVKLPPRKTRSSLQGCFDDAPPLFQLTLDAQSPIRLLLHCTGARVKIYNSVVAVNRLFGKFCFHLPFRFFFLLRSKMQSKSPSTSFLIDSVIICVFFFCEMSTALYLQQACPDLPHASPSPCTINF